MTIKTSKKELKEEELKRFLVDEKDFGEDTLKEKIAKFKEAKTNKPQASLESFFGKPTVTIHEANLKKNTKKKGAAASSQKKVVKR